MESSDEMTSELAKLRESSEQLATEVGNLSLALSKPRWRRLDILLAASNVLAIVLAVVALVQAAT